ncbi:MAG: sigma-70 family RNA polymerase sigma factor [Chloroflexota bacterium]
MDAFQAASDELLLLGTRLRDEIALAVMYDRYGALVYTLALRIVQDRGLAESVMHDVFLRCWRGEVRYVPSYGSASAWLFGMTRALALDTARERQSGAGSPVAGGEQSHPEWESSLPERGEAVVLRAMVGEALTVLSQSEREAVELAYYGGMTQQQIADRLGQPPSAIGTRIRDGMRLLCQALAPVVATTVVNGSGAS